MKFDNAIEFDPPSDKGPDALIDKFAAVPFAVINMIIVITWSAELGICLWSTKCQSSGKWIWKCNWDCFVDLL